VKSRPIEKSGVALGRRFNKHAWLLPVLTLLLFLPVTGCHRDEVKVYRVAKDQDQPQPQTAPALPTDSPNPNLPPGHPGHLVRIRGTLPLRHPHPPSRN
jgi:hypothetical protein